jgi:hypothetical protein
MEKKIVITGTVDRGSMRRMMPAAPCTRRPLDPISQLQQTGGNQAVQRLFESGVIQAKLTVGPPNDIYEQEADRVADQVMRMSDTSVDAVQRKPG